ncbi:hypothetical protein OAA06_01460 [bacterium]|nr:hypothetical protein [bacterium]
MKYLLLFILSTAFSNLVCAQDLIVTNEGDSINCRITKVKSDYIYFTYKSENEYRSTLIPSSRTTTHQSGYYQSIEVPKEKVVNHQEYQKFRFALNGGYAYRIGPLDEDIPSDFRSYIDQMRSGYSIGGDATYFFSKTLGVGMKYIYFNTSNSMDNIYVEEINQPRRFGDMSDDIDISFIGPSFFTRFMLPNKNQSYHVNFSIGYMIYSHDNLLIDRFKYTGTTSGTALDIGYDFGLSENLSIGLQISLIGGSLGAITKDDGTDIETLKLESGDYESLNRIDFSIGLRFNK